MIKTKEVNKVDEINAYLDKGWRLNRIKDKGGKIEIILEKDEEKIE